MVNIFSKSMSLWLHTKRVARYGFIGFIRNGFISLSAVLMLTITLFVLAGLLMSGSALRATLQELTEKVDVNVYFSVGATEDEIMGVKRAVEALPEVAEVTYTTQDQALAQFRQRHASDQLTLQALDQVGENPLGASLSVRAKDTSKYESISDYLEKMQTSGIGGSIEKVNFHQNKTAIDRLTDIIQTTEKFGFATALIFGIASVLIAFNTIRLAIYTSRDEIGVMNLVGAGRWYVRGPFMIAGVLYGLVSGILVLLLLYPLSAWMAPGSERFFGGAFNTYSYYASSFGFLFFVLVGTGVALGALSSFLAIRRYLSQ